MSPIFGFGKGDIPFSQGGVCEFGIKGPEYDGKKDPKYSVFGRKGYIGWQGYGGSVLQWNPTHQIGFGYNPFLHH